MIEIVIILNKILIGNSNRVSLVVRALALVLWLTAVHKHNGLVHPQGVETSSPK